jgi:hypothetical protein
VVIERFRAVEAWCLLVIRTPPIWAAIRALADKLMGAGTLDGDAAAAICAQFFEPGGLAAPAPLEEL